MGHRRFLRDSKHPYRLQNSNFNGKEEHNKAPIRLTGEELLSKMESMKTSFGKLTGGKRNGTPWSKRSIFFDLPYWKELYVRHNLDVMHVEKNFTEILFGTILNVKGSYNKDGVAARQDLKRLKIKRNLWMDPNGKQIPPDAPFDLSTSEKQLIFQTLSKLKVPIGYSGNWKHKVDLQQLQFRKMKSHDYHILIYPWSWSMLLKMSNHYVL